MPYPKLRPAFLWGLGALSSAVLMVVLLGRALKLLSVNSFLTIKGIVTGIKIALGKDVSFLLSIEKEMLLLAKLSGCFRWGFLIGLVFKTAFSSPRFT